MFKKELQTNNLNKMSNKDKNKLKERLAKCLSPQAVEAISNCCKDLWTKKIQGVKGIIYFNGDTPVLVDYTDHEDYFPTLHLLAQQPQLLPCIVMKEGVEAFVLKGANLMWPGVRTRPLIEYTQGTLVSIVTSEGIIVGVGAMKGDNKSEMTGVACTLLHFLDDGIWRLLTKGAKVPKMPKFEVVQEKEKVEQQVQEQNEQYSEEEVSQADQLTPEQMSQLFQQCLLTTISLNQPKKTGPIIQLPMDSGQFYSQWIKRACPQNIKMDIQHSTFKKLSIFYQQMEKKGYLELKTKKQGNSTTIQIASLNYQHEILTSFKPRIGRMKEDQREKAKTAQLFPLELHQNLAFIQLYNLKSLPFLFGQKIDPNQVEKLYEYQQATKLIRQYQDKIQAHEKKKGVMRFNLKEQPELQVLFKSQLPKRLYQANQDKKYQILEENKEVKADPYLFQSSRKDFESRCLDAMQPWTIAQLQDGTRVGQPIKGHSKVIQIYTTFQKIRLVTWLCNLQEFISAPKVDEHLADFAKYLCNRFSCGAAYIMHRGFPQIMVQGNVVKKLMKMLTEQYGLPEKNIDWKEPIRKKKGKKK